MSLQSQCILQKIPRRRTPGAATISLALYIRSLRIGISDNPRCVFTELPSRQQAVRYQAAYRGQAYRQFLGSFVKRRFAAFGPFACSIDRNGLLTAEGAHRRSRPAVSPAG